MTNSASKTETRTWRQHKATQAGWVLMIASFALWALVPLLPFLAVSNAERVAAVGSIFIAAEIAFWVGALMAGPDAAQRLKSWWRNAARESGAAIEPIVVDDHARTKPS